MKLTTAILFTISLNAVNAFAQAPVENIGRPADVVENPNASPTNDADVKGTLTSPTAEQKKKVEEAIKPAHEKAKKTEKGHKKTKKHLKKKAQEAKK